jgi:hypothetical protein
LLYVDDIFANCRDSEPIRQLYDDLKNIYKEVKVNYRTNIPFLGMNFDFQVQGTVKISMIGYVEDLLAEYKKDLPKRVFSTPAGVDLFDSEEEEVSLTTAGKTRFHTLVAKLLYLAKRTRPDILTAVSYLTTRVQNPSERDEQKIFRVLGYLVGTRELGIAITPSGSQFRVDAYIDASYAPHMDGKSHSGLYVTMGKGPIFYRSSKQKIVTKSSTESELIALSDESSHLLWCRSFLESQGYKLPPSKVFEDNQSSISMLKTPGRVTSGRTKHIKVRYFYLREKIEEKEVDLQYMSTRDMIADILTKPLQGKSFKYLRNKLLNWA